MYALRPYQEEGTQFLVDNKRVILGDVPRLGKTAQTITALKRLHEQSPINNILILCPGQARFVWQDELAIWWPEIAPLFKIVKGIPDRRRELWKHPYLICGYGMFRQDMKGVSAFYWHAVVTDEAHKFKNRKTQLYAAVKKLSTVFMFQLTGTPATRGPQDLWALLNILHPRVWTSYWKFVNTYCVTLDGEFGGKEIIGTKNMPLLQKMIARTFLRRTKKDVRPDLPQLQRSLLPVAMTRPQYLLYKKIADDMLDDDADIVVSDVLAKITRLRQLLVCPALLDPSAGYGGAVEMLCDTLSEMDANSRHVVIFSVFTEAFDIIKDALHNSGIEEVHIIAGGMTPENLRLTANNFNAGKGVMLCSLMYAQSFSLATATAAYVLGYDWDPGNNYQAESRIDDMVTMEPKMVQYCQYRGTIDDRALEINDNKMTNVLAIMRTRMNPHELRLVLYPKGEDIDIED